MTRRSDIIRSERPADVALIRDIHRASFPTEAEARLVDLLRDADHLTISIVAISDGALVGHVAFSPVRTATRSSGTGLGPIAALPSHRRKGIAAELVRSGLEACKSLDIAWCVVLGDPQYYSRFGFQSAQTFGLCDEYGGESAFQVIELIPNGLPRGAGLVTYAPEFQSLG